MTSDPGGGRALGHNAPVEPAHHTDAAATSGAGTTVDARAVVRGAMVGLALVVPVTIVGAALDRAVSDFGDSGWRVAVFFGILAGYVCAGWYAARLAPPLPLITGALAGLGTFVAWVPVRILIWLARDDSRGLFGGSNPVFRLGQLLGQVVLASAAGMAGGWLARRAADRNAGRPPAR